MAVRPHAQQDEVEHGKAPIVRSRQHLGQGARPERLACGLPAQKHICTSLTMRAWS